MFAKNGSSGLAGVWEFLLPDKTTELERLLILKKIAIFFIKY